MADGSMHASTQQYVRDSRIAYDYDHIHLSRYCPDVYSRFQSGRDYSTSERVWFCGAGNHCVEFPSQRPAAIRMVSRSACERLSYPRQRRPNNTPPKPNRTTVAGSGSVVTVREAPSFQKWQSGSKPTPHVASEKQVLR